MHSQSSRWIFLSIPSIPFRSAISQSFLSNFHRFLSTNRCLLVEILSLYFQPRPRPCDCRNVHCPNGYHCEMIQHVRSNWIAFRNTKLEISDSDLLHPPSVLRPERSDVCAEQSYCNARWKIIQCQEPLINIHPIVYNSSSLVILVSQ